MTVSRNRVPGRRAEIPPAPACASCFVARKNSARKIRRELRRRRPEVSVGAMDALETARTLVEHEPPSAILAEDRVLAGGAVSSRQRRQVDRVRVAAAGSPRAGNLDWRGRGWRGNLPGTGVRTSGFCAAQGLVLARGGYHAGASAARGGAGPGGRTGAAGLTPCQRGVAGEPRLRRGAAPRIEQSADGHSGECGTSAPGGPPRPPAAAAAQSAASGE